MKPGGQIAVTRAVARLAVQIAQAEERHVSVVIERALRAYALASPEWQAQQGEEKHPWALRLPPQRDGDAQQHDGSDHHPEHDIAHREA